MRRRYTVQIVPAYQRTERADALGESCSAGAVVPTVLLGSWFAAARNQWKKGRRQTPFGDDVKGKICEIFTVNEHPVDVTVRVLECTEVTKWPIGVATGPSGESRAGRTVLHLNRGNCIDRGTLLCVSSRQRGLSRSGGTIASGHRLFGTETGFCTAGVICSLGWRAIPSTPGTRARERPKWTELPNASIHRLRKQNEFPEQVGLGERSVGWRTDTAEAWIEERKPVR